ncbi:MAG: phosphodiester glycosidase family protein [Leptolyngbya sp. RL_3_1]|nr:phosphodiester glycosidase family protein [Leptolyngbya sp. RL_3_1]
MPANPLLVAIHNSPGGRGPTLTETAQIMVQLGSINALNLDGGNSASLYLGGTMLNRHPQTAVRVHNGLGVLLVP